MTATLFPSDTKTKPLWNAARQGDRVIVFDNHGGRHDGTVEEVVRDDGGLVDLLVVDGTRFHADEVRSLSLYLS